MQFLSPTSGKEGQGMRTPLLAQKRGGAMGVIASAPEAAENVAEIGSDAPHGSHADAPPPAGPQPGPHAKGAVTFRGRPSRVLLLLNMAGAGEVGMPATPRLAFRDLPHILESLSG